MGDIGNQLPHERAQKRVGNHDEDQRNPYWDWDWEPLQKLAVDIGWGSLYHRLSKETTMLHNMVQILDVSVLYWYNGPAKTIRSMGDIALCSLRDFRNL